MRRQRVLQERAESVLVGIRIAPGMYHAHRFTPRLRRGAPSSEVERPDRRPHPALVSRLRRRRHPHDPQHPKRVVALQTGLAPGKPQLPEHVVSKLARVLRQHAERERELAASNYSDVYDDRRSMPFSQTHTQPNPCFASNALQAARSYSTHNTPSYL